MRAGWTTAAGCRPRTFWAAHGSVPASSPFIAESPPVPSSTVTTPTFPRSSWESDKPTFRFGVYHQEARKPVAPLGQTRPWQRYRWQIEDIWRVNDRGEKYRIARPTDPTRLHPKGGRGFLRGDGVSLRCLVCLRLTTGLDYARRKMDTLRDDQVCPECEDDWTQAEEPWGTKYERWVTQRRADRWGPVP